MVRQPLLAAYLVLSAMTVWSKAQDTHRPAPDPKQDLVKDLVAGSIHHRPHGKRVEWERITGEVHVISPVAVQFSDGTPIDLGQAPDLNEQAEEEAVAFLHDLVDDQQVTSFGYAGDTNLQHELIINGWGLADHSSLHPAEIIARENRRGFWRDQGIVPSEPGHSPNVIKDRVIGSSNHDKGREWDRISGTVTVVDAHTLEFSDGTQVLLHVIAPDLNQKGMIDGSLYPCGEEAADFLRTVIGDKPVQCFLVEAQDDKWIGYAGDTNLAHALIINGWGLAHHSSLHPAEITAREHKRGMWRGQFVDPEEWRAGQRLQGEQ